MNGGLKAHWHAFSAIKFFSKSGPLSLFTNNDKAYKVWVKEGKEEEKEQSHQFPIQ